MKHEAFHYRSLEELMQERDRMQLDIPLSQNMNVLKQAFTVAGKQLPNALAIQPMEGCDGTAEGSPGERTIRRYERFAKSGAALIWMEATAIVEKGRANPNQLWIRRENLDNFKRFTEKIKEDCRKENGFEPLLIMQATHSGRYSRPGKTPEPVIAYNNPLFEKNQALPESCIISDDELKQLEEQFAESAVLAEEAGFDGIDIKCCHRYLCSELLSAYTREGEFGGSFENRTRLLRNGMKYAADATGREFMVTSRLNVYDGFPYPYGWGVGKEGGTEPDLTEPLELIRQLRLMQDLDLLDITIGNPYVNPHVNRPYDHGPYTPEEHPLEGIARMVHCVGTVQKTFPDLCVISSGMSYLRAFSANQAAGMVEQGYCRMAGFGREAFAYPDFIHDLLQKGSMDPAKCCVSCSKCTELMRMGQGTGCVIRDPMYTELYRKAGKQS